MVSDLGVWKDRDERCEETFKVYEDNENKLKYRAKYNFFFNLEIHKQEYLIKAL